MVNRFIGIGEIGGIHRMATNSRRERRRNVNARLDAARLVAARQALPWCFGRETAALTTELLVAMVLLTAALFPLAYSFATEKRLARTYYQRSIAMEIVDGEMERLVAGAWHSYKPRLQDYTVHAMATTNLPPGKFQLSIEKDKMRLEWLPDVKMHGGPVLREVKLQ